MLLAEHYGYTVEELTVLSGGHSIGFSASTNPQVLAKFHPLSLDIRSQPSVHMLTARAPPLRTLAVQGTVSANSRYFSNKYYKQVILGDAFFGSDKALADSNSTLQIVQELAADQDLFYEKFTSHFLDLTWKGVDPAVKRLGL